MNEEITVAIEELRNRPNDKAWFLPVRLNECNIPDFSIGAGETLRSIHYVDLFDDRVFGINRLVASVARGPSYDRARDAASAADIPAPSAEASIMQSEELARASQEKPQSSQRNREASLLAEFSRDLTQAARDNQLEQPVGHERALVAAIEILCHRTRNNAVLVGEPGVGTTDIVEGLAYRIAHSEVPPFLVKKRILALDLSLIVAGTKYRGQFEERLKTIVKECTQSLNLIVFIEELHTLVELNAANILKPLLLRGDIQCIGATTPAEYRKSIEKNPLLERHFKVVKVPPPSEADAIKILFGVKERYEKFHVVSYTEDAIVFSVAHSNRYLPDRYLPGKAMDILDEAGVRVKLRQTSLPEEVTEVQKRLKSIIHGMENAIANREFEKASFYSDEERKERENLRILREKYHLDESFAAMVGREDIEDVVSRWTGLPIASIREEESQKLLRIEEELHKRVVSQHRAITVLARAIRRSRAGFRSSNRPIGSFLFLGPTGVGKTEVARTVAEFMFGSEKSLIRFDMSEFMEKHSITKLIGSPPGYVGYEEGGQLTERVKRAPYSVVLLDGVERAHPDVFNLLLQVFEDGQVTDGQGNTVDFKNTIIIMTSNIGARHLQKRTGLRLQSEDEEMISSKVEEMVLNELKRTFNPDFLSRVDEVIIFNELTEQDCIQIVELMVHRLNAHLAQHSITVTVTEEARKWILDQTVTDRRYGARPLRRALQKYIEDPISEVLIQSTFAQRPAFIEVYLENGRLCHRQTPKV